MHGRFIKADMRETGRARIWAIVVAVLGIVVALLFAASAPGLIDDDAYIFLRYARNLADGRGLVFNFGEPSAGITSILWVLVLAAARWLTGADVLLLAQIIGACCFGAALAVMVTTVADSGQRLTVAVLSGLLAALSPVFVCQAISGMEVSLNMLLVALAMAWIARAPNRSALVCGVAFLVRPDNVLLAPLLAVARAERRWRTVVTAGFAMAVLGLPWAWYCYHIAGSVLPPTRVGKLLVFLPAWYGLAAGDLGHLPLTSRLKLAARALLRVAAIFTQGQARVLLVWLALLPLGLTRAGRRLWAPLLLLLLSALAYAWAFPLVKLRYFVHLLPWLIPVALAGLDGRVSPNLRRGLYAVLVMLFFGLSARALPRYRDWVSCEGTKTLAGRWLAEHTPPSARLALEPIGAVGYHSHRYIIDLGGLITSDVWPVLRHGPRFDPAELLAYLRARRTDYLIDAVDGPWAGRLLRGEPDSLHLTATIAGPPGCGEIGVYTVSPDQESK